MAKEGPTYPNFPAWIEGEDIDVYLAKQRAALEAIPYPIIKFPVGDGYAMYAVVSEKPLMLSHIPFMDAWAIPDAYIRGLRLTDIRRLIAADKRLAALFRQNDAS